MSLQEKLDSLKGKSDYDILGVSYDVTEEELRKARRSLLREYHPDRQKDSAERAVAEELSALVNQSYQLIVEGKATQPSLPEDTLEVKGLTLTAAVGLSAQEFLKGCEKEVMPFGYDDPNEIRKITIPPNTVAGSCILYEGLGASMDGGNIGNMIVQCIAISKKFTDEDKAIMGSQRIVMLDYSDVIEMGENQIKLFNGKKVEALKVTTAPHLLLVKQVASRGQDNKSLLIQY